MGIFGNKRKRKQFAPTGGVNRKTLHENLDFFASEQYKLIRENLDFTVPIYEKCPVVGITSSMRGEGKSTTAINLSYVLAEKGSRVLLIDGDLRLPSIAKKMNMESSPGLTDLLMGKGASISDFQSSVLKNWYILPSGNIPPNPSELLGSRRMETVLTELKEAFDYIIIDLPPVNIVSDALAVAGYITGMMVVIREDYTQKKELEHCLRLLNLSNVNILGCVMNETKYGNTSYKKYDGKRYRGSYRSYSYSYYRKPIPKNNPEQNDKPSEQNGD